MKDMELLLKRLIPVSPFKNRTYIVGGYVRDQVLGIASKDIDLVAEEKGGAEALSHWIHKQDPEKITFPHCLGAGYPIWQVVFKDDIEWEGTIFHTKGCEIEIADTQAELFPDPTTRQRVTVFGNLDEDCKRRDFTANMLYLDLTQNKIIDPSGTGLSDIKDGLLRGHPQVKLEKIFSDDPLRMLRLLRFHCKFNWAIAPEVFESVKNCAQRMEILSAERIRDEIIKMCETGRFYLGLELMHKLNLLPYIFPELTPMLGCTQDKIYHSEGDVWVHTLLVVKNAPATVVLQLAALLHDCGKPATRTEHGERIKFLGHEVISVKIAESLLKRLRFDSHTISAVKQLIGLHMRGGDVENWSSLKPARRLIRDSDEQLENLLQLIEADSRSSMRSDGSYSIEHIKVLRELLEEAKVIPIMKKSILSGFEIMEILQIKAGKKVAQAKLFLENLEDDYAAQKKILTKEEATAALKKAQLYSDE